MAYRDDLQALEARHAALDADVDRLARERDAAAKLLDEARAQARLPVLDNIRIASPCKADWNAMTGDERVRHCAQCDKDVFNLSEMTRAEAESLIRERAGNLCARYYQRSDGTILLADCTVGISRKRKMRVVAAGAAALLAGGGVLAYKLSRPSDPPRAMLGGAQAVTPSDEIMGKVAYHPPAPTAESVEYAPVMGGMPPIPQEALHAPPPRQHLPASKHHAK